MHPSKRKSEALPEGLDECLRRAFVSMPPPDVERLHLCAIVNAIDEAARTAAPKPARPVTALRVGRVGRFSRATTLARLAAVGSAAVLAVPLAMTGLAFAGVSLPGPAEDAFEALGIELPNQTDAEPSPVGSPAAVEAGDDGGVDEPAGTGSGASKRDEQPGASKRGTKPGAPGKSGNGSRDDGARAGGPRAGGSRAAQGPGAPEHSEQGGTAAPEHSRQGGEGAPSHSQQGGGGPPPHAADGSTGSPPHAQGTPSGRAPQTPAPVPPTTAPQSEPPASPNGQTGAAKPPPKTVKLSGVRRTAAL